MAAKIPFSYLNASRYTGEIMVINQVEHILNELSNLSK